MKTKKRFSGIVVPAITPLTAALTLDHGAVEKMFNSFYGFGIYPFIIGTTGESASLTWDIKKDYVKKAAALKKSNTLLYAGISSNCLEESVEFSKFCFGNGVDVVAATLPSYYTLAPAQMKAYFSTLAAQVPGPLIIYNIPATTHMSIPLDIINDLSHHENIVGTKDSERSEERLKQSIDLWATRPDFSHFLGWAAKSAEALIQGGDGLIPSSANFAPAIYAEMLTAVEEGDYTNAYHQQQHSDAIGDLYQKGRSLGESLAALKVLMHSDRTCERFMMPPLTTLIKTEEDAIIKAKNEIITEHYTFTK